MEEEEPGEDRSSLRGNSMARSVPFKKGGHGTSLFFCWVNWVEVNKIKKLYKPNELNGARRGES
jgi:hypothetical protein